jgi:hypothetical protein
MTLLCITPLVPMLVFLGGYGFREDTWTWWLLEAGKAAPTAGLSASLTAVIFFLALPNPEGARMRQYGPLMLLAAFVGGGTSVLWATYLGSSVVSAVGQGFVSAFSGFVFIGIARLSARMANTYTLRGQGH